MRYKARNKGRALRGRVRSISRAGHSPLPDSKRQDSIQMMAKLAKKAAKARTVRARVRGGSLDLLDRIPLRDGDEVIVTISEAVPARDIDALRRAAGAWRGLIDADELITNIYADRLISTRPSPNA